MQWLTWLKEKVAGPSKPLVRDPELITMRERVEQLERQYAAVDALDVEIDVIIRRKPNPRNPLLKRETV